MSFEPKKRNELEMDELNIKSYLNTSLEAEGINVSEDLINRTMNAIRLKEAEELDTDREGLDHKKPIFIYRHARSLVTVAAAALILAVGLSAIRMYAPLGMKKDMSKSDNSIAYDDAGISERYTTQESAAKDNDVANDIYFTEDSKLDAKMAENIDEDEVSIASEEDQYVDMLNSEEIADGNEITDRVASIEYNLTFHDLTQLEYSDVSSITITSKATDKIKSLNNRDQIDGFFRAMDNYLFMQGSGEDTATQYIIKLASKDSDSQIIIGETTLTVDNTHMDVESHSIYSVTDQNELLQYLKELMAN